jgi:hypothetical protein
MFLFSEPRRALLLASVTVTLLSYFDNRTIDSTAFKVKPFSDLSKTMQYSFKNNLKKATSILIPGVHSVAMIAVLTRTRRVAKCIVL